MSNILEQEWIIVTGRPAAADGKRRHVNMVPKIGSHLCFAVDNLGACAGSWATFLC